MLKASQTLLNPAGSNDAVMWTQALTFQGGVPWCAWGHLGGTPNNLFQGLSRLGTSHPPSAEPDAHMRHRFPEWNHGNRFRCFHKLQHWICSVWSTSFGELECQSFSSGVGALSLKVFFMGMCCFCFYLQSYITGSVRTPTANLRCSWRPLASAAIKIDTWREIHELPRNSRTLTSLTSPVKWPPILNAHLAFSVFIHVIQQLHSTWSHEGSDIARLHIK